MTIPPVVWSSALFNRTGYAEEARMNILALHRAGVPVYADPRVWVPWQKPLAPGDAERLEDLVALQWPDRFVHVMHLGPHLYYRDGRAIRHVGRTMWETDGLPSDWIAMCNAMDEIWVPSDFNLRTFADAGVAREKLHKIPECLQTELYEPDVPALDLPSVSGFVFLGVLSWSRRKGWDVLVRAYLDEFRADEPVTLVLLVTPFRGTVADHELELRAFVENDLRRDPARSARIVVLDMEPGTAGMPRLYRAADAYVMPSRGEGWGRPLMEAMAVGLPTIATGWSGNLEFMNDENSFLVEHTLVPVDDAASREWPRFRGQRWAEPSVEHLRQVMRYVLEQPEVARRKGARAREDVLRQCSFGRLSSAIVERLPTQPHGSEVAGSVTSRRRGFSLPSFPRRPRLTVLALASADAATELVASVEDIADELIRIPAVGDADGAAVVACRNEALARARGGYVLVIGAGETLDDRAREAIRASTRLDERAGYLLRHVRTDGPTDGRVEELSLRLFPRDERIRYAGPEHGQLAIAALGRMSRILPLEGTVRGPSTGAAPPRGSHDVATVRSETRAAPDEPVHAYRLGIACVASGLREEAIVEFERAITLAGAGLRPGHYLQAVLEAHVALATLSLDARPPDAAGWARRAAVLAPDAVHVHALFAAALMRTGLDRLALRARDVARGLLDGRPYLPIDRSRSGWRSLLPPDGFPVETWATALDALGDR